MSNKADTEVSHGRSTTRLRSRMAWRHLAVPMLLGALIGVPAMATAQPALEPLGIAMEGWPYPFPVRFHEFTLEGETVRQEWREQQAHQHQPTDDHHEVEQHLDGEVADKRQSAQLAKGAVLCAA